MGWLKKILKNEDDGQKQTVAPRIVETKTTEKQPVVEDSKNQAKKKNVKIVKTAKISQDKGEEKVAISKKKVKIDSNSIAHRVLLSPLVTEKSAIAESQGKYSFLTVKWATKLHVKKAIADLFGERPVAVNIINIDGRQLNFKRMPGRRSDYKKAIITLKKGATINIHTGV